jgi:hypothetical protein
MTTIMSQSVPSRPLTALEQGGFGDGDAMSRSEYDKNAQIKGSLWSTISPAMLARKVFNKVRSQLAQVNQNQTFVYDDGPGTFYPGGNTVLAQIDRQNDRWETLSDPIYGGPRIGRRADKNLFERTLYQEMLAPKQKGRDLTALKRVGLAKNLPEDVEGIIGQFLTGKKGTTGSQMDQLQQSTGVSMAPRPSGRPTGGRTRRRRARKTRRKHK